MSTDFVELIRTRLNDELERLGIKPAAAAKAAGEKDSQGLRDVLGGRKRLTAELLAGLANADVDTGYVLFGSRAEFVQNQDERELLALFRSAPLAVKAAAIGALQRGSAPAAPKITTGGGSNVQVVEGSQVNHGPVTIGNKIIKSREKKK